MAQVESNTSLPAEKPKEETEFIPWTSGNPFVYPLPITHGNPFVEILEHRTEDDRLRCDVWKDEVQTLLIFAGLFSAVVTAFIIDSYKWLQNNSDDPSVVLLAQILYQIEDRNTTATNLGVSIPQTSPTPSDIRVNILWFLSLIFSLSVVLIGTVSLQWLREHLRGRRNLEPQIAFSLHQLSLEALERWYIPQIFTMLPLLLQLALILFLIGIVDFLWHLNTAVAIPVAIAAASSVLFILATTALPTLQMVSLLIPRWLPADKPRVPCPYKSPQSWAFFHLVRPFVETFLKVTHPHDSAIWKKDLENLAIHNMMPENNRKSYESVQKRKRRPSHYIFRDRHRDTHTANDIAWLFQRDLDFMDAQKSFTPQCSDEVLGMRPIPIYDAVLGLLSSPEGPTSHEVSCKHQCVERIVVSNDKDTDYARYLHFLLQHFFRVKCFSVPVTKDFELDILRDQNIIHLYWCMAPTEASLPKALVQHFTELAVRVTHNLFARGPQAIIASGGGTWATPLKVVRDVIQTVSGSEAQFMHIIEQIFGHASQHRPKSTDIGADTFYSLSGYSFLEHVADILASVPPSSPLFSQHLRLLQSITHAICANANTPESSGLNYLLFSSRVYTGRLLFHHSEVIRTEIGHDLLSAVLRHSQRLPAHDEELHDSLGISDWKWERFLKMTHDSGVVLGTQIQSSSEYEGHYTGDTIVEFDHH